MKKFKFLTFLGATLLALSGCANKCGTLPYCDELIDPNEGKICISFDTCIDLKTNTIKNQYLAEPGKVKKPVVVIIDENPDSLAVYGWYKDKAYTTEWNFKTDKASENMTLYAKFVSQYKVNYYQGFDENSMNLLATETVFKDSIVPTREDLPDCYENPETVYVTNLEANADGSMKGTKGGAVNFSKDKVTSQVNILMTRSKEFYLSPGAISRRFTPVASCAGSNGSTIGKIEVLNPGKSTEAAQVDFGIVNDRDSVFDPYILMDNPAIDVTNSQYIEIKMKNLGAGSALSFYWVGKWKVNGEWINGKEYHSFAEDRRFAFKKGLGTASNGTVYEDMNGKVYKNKQTTSDPWETYLLPISHTTDKGVSTWGCAGKITALRIQSTLDQSLKGKSDEAKKNVLQIKYIKGVKATNETFDFTDSDAINVLKINDAQGDIDSAASGQQAINGFIFPKDNASISTEETTAKVYKKTDGIYVGGDYASGTQTISLVANKAIDIDTHTTFKFGYLNKSYMEKITFTFKTKFTVNGNEREKKVSTTFSMSTRMNNLIDEKINMFGTNNFKGVITGIDITFTPIGVDNLIKFTYLEFTDYEAKSLNGINFNDLYCGKITYPEGIEAEYDSVHKGSKLVVNNDTKTFDYEFDLFNTTAIDKFVLSYQKPDAGITKVDMTFTTANKVGEGKQLTSKTYSLNLDTTSSTKKIETLLEEKGYLEKVTFKFTGTGTIYLQSVNWLMLQDALDFTTTEYYSTNHHFKDDCPNYIYDSNELALSTNQGSSTINGRLGIRGVVSGLKRNGELVTNFSMAGKTKIIIMYQNRTAQTGANLSFGAILKNEFLTDKAYLTQEHLIHNGVTIEGETVIPNANDASKVSNMKTNMSAGEWDVISLDINPFFTRSGDLECYCTELYFATPSDMGGQSILVRSIAMI